VNVTRANRHRFEAIVSDRSAPQQHVWRANIILATADGCGTAEIMAPVGRTSVRARASCSQNQFCGTGSSFAVFPSTTLNTT